MDYGEGVIGGFDGGFNRRLDGGLCVHTPERVNPGDAGADQDEDDGDRGSDR